MNIDKVNELLRDIYSKVGAIRAELTVAEEPPKPEPEPEPETAFQGVVRRTLVKYTGNEDWLTASWVTIEVRWGKSIDVTRTAFNDAIELAKQSLILGDTYWKRCERVDALKESASLALDL